MDILGHEVKIKLSDENLIEKYFNLEKGTWHDNGYHVSMMIRCLKRNFLDNKNGREPGLEEMGAFKLGNMIHEEIQGNLEKKDGYYIKEFPFCLEISENVNLLGKVDLIHNKDLELTDIKSITHYYMPDSDEKVSKDYVIQVIAYTFIMNNTYYVKEPIKNVKIVFVSKKNLEVKEAEIEYSDSLGMAVFEWLVERTKTYHDALMTDTVPKGDVNDFCKFCPYNRECVEARELLAELLPPIDEYTLAFNKLYPKKKAYWKFDKESRTWIETKLFKQFKIQYDKQKSVN